MGPPAGKMHRAAPMNKHSLQTHCLVLLVAMIAVTQSTTTATTAAQYHPAVRAAASVPLLLVLSERTGGGSSRANQTAREADAADSRPTAATATAAATAATTAATTAIALAVTPASTGSAAYTRLVPRPVGTPRPMHLDRRSALSLTINYTGVFMFCYRDAYARAPKGAGSCSSPLVKSMGLCYKKCGNTFRGRGPLCVRQCPAFEGQWVNCGYGCAPSFKQCVLSVFNQANSVAFLTYKVKLPDIEPYIDPAFDVAIKLQEWWQKVNPSTLTTLRLRPDSPSITSKLIEKRTLNALFIANYAKPVRGTDRRAITFVPPETKDKAAAFAEFRSSRLVLSEVAYRTAKGLISTLGILDIVINLEDAAKYDPSGVLAFLFAFGHLPCSRVKCVRCYAIRAESCLIAPKCVNNKCSNSGTEVDGTSCSDFDNFGKSYSGACQAGKCVSDSLTSFYRKRQRASLWIPAGYIPPNDTVVVDPSLYSTTAEEYVKTSNMVAHVLASRSGSCTFNNGGCGSFICDVDEKTNASYCIDPHDFGFAPSPMAVNFPSGETLEYRFPLSPLECINRCTLTLQCVLAQTTLGHECWLKRSIGEPLAAQTHQAFKKLK